MKQISRFLGGCLAVVLAACQSPNLGGPDGPIGHDYTWAVAGTPSFNTSAVPSLAASSSGVYAAYVDASSGKTSVQKFDGATWSPVGQLGIGSPTNTVSIAVDSNQTPYVVYRDSASANKATSWRFNGLTWEQAGDAGFSTPVTGQLALVAGNGGTMYCALNSSSEPGLSLYRFNGTAWSSISPDSRFDGLFFLQRNSLASDGAGGISIALQSYSLSDPGIQVFQYVSGTTWQKVGKTFAPTTGISNDQVTISVGKTGKPYVAYIENPETDHQVSVMHFDGND